MARLPSLLALGLTIAGCRPDPMRRPIEPSVSATSALPTSDQPSALAAIVAGLVPMEPGGSSISREHGAAVDACAAYEWPEILQPAVAAGLAETAVGSHATVVHAEGTTGVTIESIGCSPPDGILGTIAWLNLESPPPEGPTDPSVPEALRGLIGRRHLAVFGATVTRTAKLVEPPVIDLRTSPALREIVLAHATRIAAARHEGCKGNGDPEARPTPAATAKALPAAVDGVRVHPVRSGDETLSFVVLGDTAITFDCYGRADDVAQLLDVDGEVLLDRETNNGIELQWLMDLDGDGVQEALVDSQQLEDGGHDIALWYFAGGTWTDATLWAAATP